MFARNVVSLLLALPTAGAANAQESDLVLDSWIDRQVERYIELSGVSTADRLMWCDPAPDCEIIPLRAGDADDGLSIFIVVVNGSGNRAEMEFLRRQVEIIRALRGNVLQAGSQPYWFGVALRNRLSDTRYHIPTPPRR